MSSARHDRRHFYRRAALAPLCLCLVAALHVIRVWTCRQTPWKGGGFGMFSTVDDESARFLRCYLVTEHGDFPMPIPPAADKSIAELRAAPSQQGLQNLANRLAEQSWRWRDKRLAREGAAIHARHGLMISSASLRKPAEQELVLLAGDEHAIEPIPRDESRPDAIAFHAVRIECWRYRYSARTNVLDAERVMTASAEPKP